MKRDDVHDRLRRLMTTTETDFIKLVEMAGLDPTRDFRHANLAATVLSGLDLSGFNFSDANFADADLRDADFSNANVDGAHFERAKLDGAHFKAKREILPPQAVTERQHKSVFSHITSSGKHDFYKMEIHKVGVVGAGTMGNGIAQAFATSGYDVVMRDIKQEFVDRGMSTIRKSLERMAARNKISGEAKDAALARVKGAVDIAPLGDCDLIVEAALENVDLKTKLFKELDEVCKADAILATNTSSISVTKIAAATKRPNKVIGMHFFNPVPVMQLIEVIRALQTDDETCEAVLETSRKVGKTPHLVKDSYGFVVNRVLIPMINEAINCLYEGLAGPDDIDDVMKLGANHPIGPLALADLIGLDVTLNVMETLYQGFEDPKYRPSPLLKQMVDAGYLGRKSGRGFHKYES